MTALVAIMLAFLFPILWMLTKSFQAGEKMFQLDTEWIPSVWHPDANALRRANFPLHFLNSGVVSAIVMKSQKPSGL